MYLHSRTKRWLGVLRKSEANLRLAAEQIHQLAEARKEYGDRVRTMSERDKGVLILEARDSIALTLESQPPPPGSWLDETLQPVIEAYGSLSYGQDFVDSINKLRAAIEAAVTPLTERVTEPDISIDDLVDELERAMLVSLLVTLTSHNTLVDRVSDWEQPHRRFMQGGNVPGDVGHYFDVRTFTYVDKAGGGLIHMQELISAIDAGTLMWVGGAGREKLDNYPEVQAVAYAQWFTYAFALWEEQFRGRIAAYFDQRSDERIRRTDVLVDYFGDIRLIRNDFVHNKGVCKESVHLLVLQWGVTRGQPIEIRAEQMMTLIDLFPRDELLTAPSPQPPGETQRVPGKVGPQLLEGVQARAREVGLTDNQLLQAALSDWLAANPRA